MSDTSFRVQGVNGIKDLTLNIEGPGVLRIIGPNGTGKSSTISAIRAVCGDATATAAVTDGEERGTVTGPGVTLRVGKRTKLDGTPEVRLVDAGALGTLIDPGLKGADARAKARMRALVELAPIPVDDGVVEILTDGHPELVRQCQRLDGVLACAESVRLIAHELARDQEAAAAEAKGQADGLKMQVSDTDLPDGLPSASDAETAYRAALRASERAGIERDARVALEQQQGEIRETLGDAPDVDAAQAETNKQSAIVDALQAAAYKAQTDLTSAAARLSVVAENGIRIREEAATHEKQAGILDRKVTGPTAEEVTAAELAVAEARVVSEQAAAAEKDRDLISRVRAARLEEVKRDQEAASLRKIATATTDGITKILEGAGIEGVTIIGGRLHLIIDGEARDFDSRTSFGQRVCAAIQVALRGDSEGMPILPLSPQFWLALDPMKKIEVDEVARASGVVLLTEEPAGGELRVETV